MRSASLRCRSESRNSEERRAGLAACRVSAAIPRSSTDCSWDDAADSDFSSDFDCALFACSTLLLPDFTLLSAAVNAVSALFRSSFQARTWRAWSSLERLAILWRRACSLRRNSASAAVVVSETKLIRSTSCSALSTVAVPAILPPNCILRPFDEPPTIAPLASTTPPLRVTIRTPPMWRRAMSIASTISVSRTTFRTAASIDGSKSSRSIANPTTPASRDTITAFPAGLRDWSLFSGRKVARPASFLRNQAMHFAAVSSSLTTMLFIPPPIDQANASS